jgi:hypothetical protein
VAQIWLGENRMRFDLSKLSAITAFPLLTISGVYVLKRPSLLASGGRRLDAPNPKTDDAIRVLTQTPTRVTASMDRALVIYANILNKT